MYFRERMKNVYNLSDLSIDMLLDAAEELSYAKKDIIIEKGQRAYYNYFVKKGFVHSYIVKEGNRMSMMFTFEGDMVSAGIGVEEDFVSSITLEAGEDTILLRISRERLKAFFQESVELANWGRKLAEKIVYKYEHYFINYFWADKTAQYLSLIEEYPELIQRVPLKELATYLNVTPQSLSRIRANIR